MEETLDSLSEKIMSLLVFEETFDALLTELPSENTFAVADELKVLIVKDYIKPCKDVLNNTNSGLLYDSDQLTSYSFRITSKGISYLERHFKKK